MVLCLVVLLKPQIHKHVNRNSWLVIPLELLGINFKEVCFVLESTLRHLSAAEVLQNFNANKREGVGI